jgi:hypothetical protein
MRVVFAPRGAGLSPAFQRREHPMKGARPVSRDFVAVDNLTLECRDGRRPAIGEPAAQDWPDLSRLNTLFTSGALGLKVLGCGFRATDVELFLQTKVADDPHDAPNANEVVGLLELLGDDLGRSIWIQETMTNDLAHHLFGAPIVGLWPAYFAVQGQRAMSCKLFQQLKIALLGVTEFTSGLRTPHLIRLFVAVAICQSEFTWRHRQINTRLKKSA